MSKKALAIVMALVLSFSILAVPTFACFDNSGKEINTENYINQLLDDVIFFPTSWKRPGPCSGG